MKYIGLAFFEARKRTLVSFVVTTFVTVYHIVMSMAVLYTLKFLQFTRIKMIFCQFSNIPTSMISMFSI